MERLFVRRFLFARHRDELDDVGPSLAILIFCDEGLRLA
jgi:hypothetical protein